MADAPKKSGKSPAKRKKVRRIAPKGFACIYAGGNNTIVTITDEGSQPIAWASSGSSGFKGTRKSTPYAAQTAAKNAAEKAREFGLAEVSVRIKGIGPGREQAVRGLVAAGLEVLGIEDVTPVPHGGCTKKRVRRV